MDPITIPLLFVAAGLCGAGFYFYIDTLERSNQFTVGEGTARIFFSGLAIASSAVIGVWPFML